MHCSLYWSSLLIVCFLLGLSPDHLIAQRKVLPFHQLTLADNLSLQSYNYYVFEDSEGYVWISSINGLNRYDGQEIVQFHPDENNEQSLFNGSIQGDFFEDNNSNIWFGTDKGVQCYVRNTGGFRNYKLREEGDSDESYKALFLNQEKQQLWVSYEDHLYWLDIENPEVYHPLIEYPVFDNTWFVEQDSLIFIYSPLEDLGGIGKVCLRNNSNYKVVTIDTLLNGEAVGSFLYEDKDHIWAITQDGLVLIDDDGNKKGSANQFMGDRIASMYTVSPYNEEALLIATRSEEEGVYLFNKNTLTFSHQVYLAQNNKVEPFMLPVERVNVGPENFIWISTKGHGVFYTKPTHKKIQAYLQNYEGSFSSKSNVQCVAEDKSGNLWCLTVGGIAVLDSSGQINPRYEQWYLQPPDFLKDDTYSISIDHEDRVWVYSYEGVFVLDDHEKGIFRQIKTTDGFGLDRTPFGIILSNGEGLVSTLSPPDSSQAGLFRIINDGDRFVCKQVEVAPQNKDYSYIFELEEGGIYLCRYNGDVLKGRLVDNRFIVDTLFALGSEVNGMVEDKEKKIIWLATSKGLYQIEGGQETWTLKENELFKIENLKGILHDQATKTLWISSTSGLYAFDPEEGTYRSFTSFEGLQSPEFNFYSALKTSTGLLAFGGINGLNLFDPSKVLASPPIVPIPKITQIQINDEPDSTLRCAITRTSNVSQFESLTLPYEKNTLSFNFSAMDYSDPASNRFKHKMEGVDEGYVNLESGNSTRYPNLPIGKHTFLVQASSTEGIWSDDKTTSLNIEILPPWYWTWWAKILWCLTLASIVYGIYRFRVNQIKKEAVLKQKEAELKQLAAETETAVLRLQMNPHFIFNSMNSISSYISERDVDTANAYLNRFAKLMRLILKLGKQPLIPVADEIDLLDQYMKTETMRFERKFGYDFDVAPEVDEDETLVPTMILQPFIENAIWHGLSGLQRKGQIIIRFWIESNTLLISITDNGVGREAAKVRKGVGTHKSQALEITKRRLQLLGEKEGQVSDFHFEDVLDSTGQVAGTRVILRLPII